MVAHSGSGWELAASLVELEREANLYAPSRRTSSDGSIGDAAHRAQGRPTYDLATGRATGGTDHQPDNRGILCALDLSDDPAGGFDAWVVANRILARVRAGLETRLNYIELENCAHAPRRKLEGSHSTGHVLVDVGPSSSGPHMHTSILHTIAAAADVRSWHLTPEDDDMPLSADDEAKIRAIVHDELNKEFTWTPLDAGVPKPDNGQSLLRAAAVRILKSDKL